MPDIWSKHPDIVRDLVKEAGFTCGVPGRFLPGRDPAWTCIYDGVNLRGDLYIHDVARLQSNADPGAGGPLLLGSFEAGALAAAFLLGFFVRSLRRRR